MSDKPIINPSIPYSGPLISALGSGKFIRILGTASPVGKGFACHLQTGSSSFDDVALQIAVKLEENKIVLNTQEHGVWNNPQTFTNTEVTRGGQFEILIVCEHTVYKIGINGKHLCEFPYKIPLYRVSHMRIEGDLSVSRISVESQPSMPPAHSYGDVAAPPPYPGVMRQPQTFPSQQVMPPQIPVPLNAAPPLNAGQQTVIYASGPYSSAPLIQQPLNTTAFNSVPTYQQPFYRRPYGYYRANKKVVLIVVGVFGLIFITFVIVMVVLHLKFQRDSEEAFRRHRENW